MGNEWIDLIKEKAGVFSKKTGEGVSYLMNIKKAEVEIIKVNHEINKILKAIGEIVYANIEDGIDESKIEMFCTQIDNKKAYIKELEKRIELLKEKKEIDETDVVCDDDIPEFIKGADSKENIAVLRFCPECNTGNELSNTVCKECGKKLSSKSKK